MTQAGLLSLNSRVAELEIDIGPPHKADPVEVSGGQCGQTPLKKPPFRLLLCEGEGPCV